MFSREVQLPFRPFMKRSLVVAHADYGLLHDFEVGLKQSGFSVHPADSRIACIAKMERFKPDLLLIDAYLMRNGCDGLSSAILRICDLTKIPVLLLARGEASANDDEIVRQFSVAEILVAPFSMSKVSELCLERIEEKWANIAAKN
ncbi:MAG: hypothetical protein SGI77_17710 [Pirellulaceae bacterium]|nr:hypothetical protein [Pirellulaceae bacterium]